MSKKKHVLIFLSTLLPVLLLSGCASLKVFDPQGPAAKNITGLINWSLVFMVAIFIVVCTLFAIIIWKYRATPKNEGYEPPEEHGNTKLELIWTIIPIIIVIALTIPTVSSVYSLEKVPKEYKDVKPVTIKVTAADWKWIFSYPEEDIETVNYVNIPAGVPVQFLLTSAGTMQSFWVPSLGGQKYAMSKMETELYLTADQPGEYYGRNTNFNGQGYSAMEFTVEAKTPEDYQEWIDEVKQREPKLTEDTYNKLLEPTIIGRQTFSSSHLAWVDHGQMDSATYTYPELYKRHGYQGEVFEEDEGSQNGMDMGKDKEGGSH